MSGYELARLLREQDDVHVELAGENVVVAVFGMGEDAAVSGGRLVAALHRAVETASVGQRDPERESCAPPPPWGELALTPREAFLGRQEVVPVRDAVGRIAAESLAAYPPGIPNVLPGERLTAETLDYIQQALDHGGSLRGASDRALRTLRVVVEP
jgi:arginine decarboxylase